MRALFLAAAMGLAPLALSAQVTEDAPARNPSAVVDLASREGLALVGGQWRTREARIVEVAHRGPGADLRATGAPNRTNDLEPLAGAADYDDSAWEVAEPTGLDARRGTGKLSFVWYRLRFTVPARVGSLDPTGTTLVLDLTMDDYAEVWVNGQLPTVLGQSGGQLIRGWNAPNRVVLTRDARPGQQFIIAILGINGPISRPPDTYIWIRSAGLQFYAPGQAGNVIHDIAADVLRLDPALDAIVPQGARIQHLASGFQFTEGPLWVREGGYLLFSDPNANRIYRWSPDGQVSVFREFSGYAGTDIGEYHQPGSNGLTLDREGRLVIDQHGNRRVVRLERNGVVTVLADRDGGRRLNSPNDLVYRSDGALYFTDPAFGLPRVYDDPRKELPYQGVYRLGTDGRLQLLTRELKGPNGIAFTPDERFLYVSNWDETRKVVMRYPVRADGSLGAGTVFADFGDVQGEEALDGLKVDQAGNLYVSGPGGLWILSPEGRRLGVIRAPELAANFAWGDEDGRTLYLTARTGLYRIRLNIAGIRP